MARMHFSGIGAEAIKDILAVVDLEAERIKLRKELAEERNETVTEISERMAKAFLDAVGASSGPLYASAFRKAGADVRRCAQ